MWRVRKRFPRNESWWSGSKEAAEAAPVRSGGFLGGRSHGVVFGEDFAAEVSNGGTAALAAAASEFDERLGELGVHGPGEGERLDVGHAHLGGGAVEAASVEQGLEQLSLARAEGVGLAVDDAKADFQSGFTHFCDGIVT